MKYLSLLFLFFLISCNNNQEILLPKSNLTFVKEVRDYSPIYLFFKAKGRDTLVEVNRKNAISSTNWIFHIDKRLPLRLVIPEIIKLQAKKEGSVHKSETTDNYFSYSDSLHKNLAFLKFSKVKYRLMKSKYNNIIYFQKNGNQLQNLEKEIQKNLKKKEGNFILCYDKNLSFGAYIQYQIALKSLNFSNISTDEFVY